MTAIYISINIFFVIIIKSVTTLTLNKLEMQYVESIQKNFEVQTTALENDILYAQKIQEIVLNNEQVVWMRDQSQIASNYQVYSTLGEIRDLLINLSSINPLIKDMGVYIENINQIISSQHGWIKDLGKLDLEVYKKEGRVRVDKGDIFIVNSPLQLSKKEDNLLCYIEVEKKELKQLTDNIIGTIPHVEVGIIAQNRKMYKTEKFRELLENSENIDEKQGFQKVKIRGKEYLLFKSEIISSQLQVIAYLDTDFVIEALYSFDILSKSLFIFMGGLLLVFLMYMNYYINKPLKKLVGLMNAVEKNNLQVTSNYITDDEFQYIFEGFDNMIASLQGYIDKTYKQEIAINKSELKQLQAQINPHFLYNCFLNISSMCRMEDSRGAMKLSQKLAKYYMYITRNSIDEVTLEDEYNHVKVYLEVQNIRFADRVQIEIPPLGRNIKGMKVPKMILQPIVENSYKYVFEQLEGWCLLKIQVDYEKDEGLKITIEDNGDFIEDEKIGELNSRLKNNELNIETTGLFNVNRRLKLKYGEESGVNLERGEAGGLKVTLLILDQEVECIDY